MRKAFCAEKRRRIGATAEALHFAALAVKYDATFKGIECFALPLKGGIFQQEKEKAKCRRKNNKGIIALIIVLVLAAAALVIWQTNKRETQQGGKEITVNVDHLNGDDTTFTIHTDEEYLRGALEQEDLIEGTESEYGLYVLTVDGETADESEQQWWGYSVNGTFAELGVDSQPVADGDVYDFVLNVGW